MKILYSCVSDLSRLDGETTHVSEIVNSFAKFGHEIHLIAEEEGDLDLHQNVRFYKIFPFINKRLFSLATQALQKIHIKYVIKKIIKKDNINLIYERYNEYNYGTKIGAENNIITLLELNGMAPIEAEIHGADKETVEKTIKKEMEMLNKPDKVIAIGHDIRNYYINRGLPKDKIEVVPIGANIDKFKPENKFEWRKKLGFNEDELLIGFIGDFRKYHGIEYAIKAMPYIIDKNKNTKLVIIGENSKPDIIPNAITVDSLKKIVDEVGMENNVIFTGRVPEVPPYLNAMDFCIAPWIVERNILNEETDRTRNVKIFEYLACGKPILTTNVGTFKEFFEENNIGLVVEPENPKELAKGALKLYSNKELLETMGKNARELVVEKFSWEHSAREILKIARELMDDIN